MARRRYRRRGNPWNRKVIDAVFSTPFIVLGSTKRKRRSAARKWWNLLTYATKM